MDPQPAVTPMARGLTFSVLPEALAICRLEKDAAIPAWAARGEFFSVTRTTDELSVICAARNVPADICAERPWRALKVRGPFDFSQVGVLASLAAPLAKAGISIFALATYDTDYVLVAERSLDQAIQVLRAAGHEIESPRAASGPGENRRKPQ